MAGDIWVIDTSSILEIRRDLGKGQLQIPKAKQPVVFKALTQLVNDETLVFPTEVLKELEHQTEAIAATGKKDIPYEWASANAKKATRFKRDYIALSTILAYDGLDLLLDIDASRSVEAADPWVLAQAYSLKSAGYSPRVITEDRNNFPDKIGLASACGIVGVPQLRVSAFLAHKGVWPTK